MTWATIGMTFSPQIEKVLGMEASSEERDELERKMAVHVERVDRNKNRD